jgi:uncharacterized membrane protein
MGRLTRWSMIACAVMLLFCLPAMAGPAPDPEYTITYTITVRDDGTAVWYVEFRTLLATPGDLAAFENYSRDLRSVYLPQFADLMQNSAAQAQAATSRVMGTGDFSGDAVVQTSPTGRYGVVSFSFSWTGFAEPRNGLVVGDAFAGGLYLAKGDTLVIRYPAGYAAANADPAPDQVREGLIWYGQRSFGAGEPRVVLERAAFPLLPVVIGGGIMVIAAAGLVVYWRKKRRGEPAEQETEEDPLSERDIANLEEAIVQLIRSRGGELYQSEIVKILGLPKSSVSSALNGLHLRGVIVKVRKGRENLIRLA